MCFETYHNIAWRDCSVIMCLSGKYKDLSSDQYVCKKPGVVACAVTPVLGSKVDREMNPYSALAAQPSWIDELPAQWETLTETIKVKNQGETRVHRPPHICTHTWIHMHMCKYHTHTACTYAKSWTGINLTHMFYSIQHTIITLELLVCSRDQWKAFFLHLLCL